MGYRENDVELKKFGIKKKKLVSITRERNIIPLEELQKDFK